MLAFTTCQMCGKDFIRQPGSIYKLNFAGRVYHFCSYHCHQEAKRCKENARKTTHEADYARFREEIIQMKGVPVNV